jgi:hypothetical protein
MGALVKMDGEVFQIIGVGTELPGRGTLLHIASTSRFVHQKNGRAPIQMNVWSDEDGVEVVG